MRWRQQAELLAKCLQWYVDNDDTNDTEDNKPWLNGKQAAVEALKGMSAMEHGHETQDDAGRRREKGKQAHRAGE